MWDKAANTYCSTIKFIPICLWLKTCMITQLIDFFVFDSIPDQYKNQEMCARVVSEDPFLTVYCLDICNTQRQC